MIRTSEVVLKQERSVPVQGRVDMMVLADLAVYLMSKGYQIRTMSTLISHIVELAHYAVESNGLMQGRHESLEDAYQNMIALGLYKGRFADRGIKKLNMSRGFENMRLEGDDPEISASMYYKGMHNQSSVSPPNIANPVVPEIMPKESIYERNREYIEKAKMEKIEESNTQCIDPNLSAVEAYPDLVIRVPSKEELAELKERKRIAEIESERYKDGVRARERAQKALEKKAAKEIAESAKIKDSDMIREKTPEEWREWNRKEEAKKEAISGDWGPPDPGKCVK